MLKKILSSQLIGGQQIVSLSPSVTANWSVLLGQGSINKMLCIGNTKRRWCHPKELKYTAVIAQNH